MSSNDGRQELLLHMYDQLFSDINRSIMVIWQSVSVVIGSFAVFALAEKNVISIDVATSLILLLCAWLLAHVQDAAYWYNRNLVIIANIERQFLKAEDLRLIHAYFGEHRPKNRMITQLRIQYVFGLVLAALVLLYHFSKQVYPGIGAPWSTFHPQRAIPYAIIAVSIPFLLRHYSQRRSNYENFVEQSPGVTIDASQIRYDSGHGFRPGEHGTE